MSSRFCLQPGECFVVHLPSGGSVEINASEAEGVERVRVETESEHVEWEIQDGEVVPVLRQRPQPLAFRADS